MRAFLARHWLKITLILIGLTAAGFLLLCVAIGNGVRDAVDHAQARHGGDPVTALIAVATDKDAGLAARNKAVWALGQLGSPEALPVLESLATGKPCDHDRLICQKEVTKAIELCSGAANYGAWTWRRGELAEAGRSDERSN